jgi:hypothetical protein
MPGRFDCQRVVWSNLACLSDLSAGDGFRDSVPDWKPAKGEATDQKGWDLYVGKFLITESG